MSIRRLLLVALVVTAGCKKASRKQTCDDLAKLTLTVADEVGKQLGSKQSLGRDPEIKARLDEFRAECMKWPDDVFECMNKLDDSSPKCQEAMALVTGRVSTNVDKAPLGPATVASADLGNVEWDALPLVLASDGTVTAAPEDAIAVYAATGEQLWRTELDHDGWLLALPDGAILVGDRAKRELVALDPATGSPRWRVAIPIAEDADEHDDRSSEAAVRIGDRVLVAIADGRFLRLDPNACAKPRQRGCLALAFALPDEDLDQPALRAVGDDIVIGESSGIRRITQDGKVVASIHVRDSFGGIALTGGRLAATIDDELVVFDLARCPATAVALPRKSGRMYFRGEGDCEDCVAPPAGCVVARADLDDVDATTPTVLRDGSVVVTNFDGPARATAAGAKQWVSEIDAVGPIREVGDAIVFVSRGEDDEPARVVALDIATGKAKWVRPLEIASRDISYTTDPIVEVSGAWLVAGAKGRVSWIRLPATKI